MTMHLQPATTFGASSAIEDAISEKSPFCFWTGRHRQTLKKPHAATPSTLGHQASKITEW
jgi:hypothetical protein